MFFKPQWYKVLPTHLTPNSDRTIENIENLRSKYGLNHDLIAMGIMQTPWAIRKAQEHCLKEGRELMPQASERELWKGVLASRLQTKLAFTESYSNTPNMPLQNPLSSEEIISMMENIDSVCNKFQSWNDVVEHIISIDRDEGAFSDPSGIINELNFLLEL